MEVKDYLTNEKIAKKFKSQFELVNYAIKLAENMIQTGREARVKSDDQNRANQVLNEIIQGKDQFDDIAIEVHEDVIEESVYLNKMEGLQSEHSHRSTERKKGRKVLAG